MYRSWCPWLSSAEHVDGQTFWTLGWWLCQRTCAFSISKSNMFSGCYFRVGVHVLPLSSNIWELDSFDQFAVIGGHPESKLSGCEPARSKIPQIVWIDINFISCILHLCDFKFTCVIIEMWGTKGGNRDSLWIWQLDDLWRPHFISFSDVLLMNNMIAD